MSDSERLEESASVSETVGTSSEAVKSVKLPGLFAFKVGMGATFSATGERIPVTILKFPQWRVSQVKTVDRDGYDAIQVAAIPKADARSLDSEKGHLKKAGFESSAYFVREVRFRSEEATVGSKVSIESLSPGDVVKATGVSKGRGFSGVIKRHGHHGGPSAHGSKFHRRPGSMGNRTWPGRVKPGRKLPGRFGFETVTLKSVTVVEVLAEDGLILVKGSLPGARNTLIKLTKVS